jgi:hypothetical protein
VARDCPAVTVWPAVTFTAVTCPETAKLRSAWLAGSIVPVAATVWVIVPVATVCTVVVVVMPVVAAAELLLANHDPTPAPAPTTTTAVAAMSKRFLREPVLRTGPMHASFACRRKALPTVEIDRSMRG